MPGNSVTKPDYRYALAVTPPEEVLALLGEIPGRWGRMPPLSRVLVVETGRVLAAAGLLAGGRRLSDRGLKVGLVGATFTGCLSTDLDFAATLEGGFHLASPALFGYTLPNIALSEAASHYGLVGPVYAIFPGRAPAMAAAIAEAERWLVCRPELDLMLAGTYDALPPRPQGAVASSAGADEPAAISLTLTVVSG
ncbi:beta-ketoacyl synthase N-terminal-like domain-containing protein [Desulfurivibrio alkaliphilus]|uniref:Beta-ketoacyl synthase N-terminal domain-containing protein n=1 Tax=Desulfurivibrio alkaliphilus (strain DSM 19089 / UNIQEM U267 / AHT2) TaxID=589865 RepID=D6Z2Q1_DESAT|nr:beta-ketoacyl synthase N-terminal-like domain-containing protein [Desulfurivibrio alkaliphilus]ADH85826.1 hypothetical protein DaAHT2_1128 [Desulfurivibrio alkaliphilus AHT 2]